MTMLAPSKIHQDLSIKELVEISLERNEGVLSADGALTTETGKRTGRSPRDRFIVKDSLTESTVDWGKVNQPMPRDTFETLWARAEDYLSDKDIFVSHLRVGADKEQFLPVKVMTEYAWHNLFCQHLFIKPQGDFAEGREPWTLMSAASLQLNGAADGVNDDGAVMIDLSSKRVLLIGMRYAGEMKKSMFSIMNYFAPEHDTLPMHCAANVGEDKGVALFFGLSGTGKTTLSADPERFLIGDDEHGWNENGVFNFEGGCYAKCINLSKEREPVIWSAIRDGAIMENVVLNNDKTPDYTDDSLTQNSRAAYPLEHIERRVLENKAGIPRSVLFLTCDLYGVLPPVSLLTKEQAAYYFLSGYTARVGSTEMGGSGNAVEPTFSTCFGAPFFPRPATIYADLLIKRIEHAGCQVYLINTGWQGGAYGAGGERFAIPVTRAIVSAAVSGELTNVETETLPGFDFAVPTHIAGVDAKYLDPRKGWSDQTAYQQNANQLIKNFQDNFGRFDVAAAIKQAGPQQL